MDWLPFQVLKTLGYRLDHKYLTVILFYTPKKMDYNQYMALSENVFSYEDLGCKEQTFCV